ncbi:hypothetical protein Pcinc_021897 [Petrolisthes cinctipes]|uniref:Neurotransmitter-gated ion-channel ligand-binding domain-containing protein n=1 Tax=Petrolisthes cinctipes TaxID=88211 RepID=A0AAE1FIY6_PETCI|nr:hypothetical protein Pcinc_021897 [Petrolisthes cinctipes]
MTGAWVVPGLAVLSVLWSTVSAMPPDYSVVTHSDLALENTSFTMSTWSCWLDCNSKVIVEFQQELRLPYTFCMWVWPLVSSKSQTIFWFLGPNNFIGVPVIEGKVSVTVNQTCPTPFPDAILEQRIWYHLCLTVTPDILTLHYQNFTYTLQVSNMKICPMQFSEVNNAEFVLGKDEFSGHFSRIRIFDRELTKDEVKDMVECRPGPIDFLSFSNISSHGMVSQSPSDLDGTCNSMSNEFLALFTICGNLSQAQDFCASKGGRLINERDGFNKMVDLILSSHDNSDPTIVVWTNETKGEELAVVLSITRDSNNTNGMYYRPRYSTTSILSVTACLLPTKNTVYLKDDGITMMSMQQYDNMLLLQSMDGHFIFRKRCHEILKEIFDSNDFEECLVYMNMAMSVEFSVIDENRALLGRHSWISPNSQNYRKITISMCDMSNFTCDDGQCIPLEDRCDGLSHCRDHSDEGLMCKTIDSLPSSYWKTSCPEQEPLVDLLVEVTGINAISLESNSFKVSLIITTSWRDKRLTFLNLQNSTKTLELEDYRKIWVPIITYYNADFADNLNLQSTTKTSVLEQFTVKATTESVATVMKSYEVMKYRGSETVISRKVQYLFTGACSYMFFAFPFDTQECYLSITLKGNQKCQPIWNTGDQGVRVLGKASTLSIYSIPYPRFSSSKPEEVKLQFLFNRRFEAYMLTTFMPCVLLCILAHITLTHFQLENFTDRITVTLSLLIVLASLFSQLSSSLPSSAEPKLVDIFFFYCCLRVGTIFIFHSLINRSMKYMQEEVENEDHVARIITGSTGTDTAMNVKMRLAWPPNSKNQKQQRRKFFTPQTINKIGTFFLLMVDALIISLLVFWAVTDHYTKFNKFNTYNVTQQ